MARTVFSQAYEVWMGLVSSRGTVEAVEPQEILDDLDDEQRAIAEVWGRPVGVIAGAGTGKTRTMTHRLAFAALGGVIEPRATMAVTFTTAAADEIRRRLETMGVHGVQSRTFHSACLRQAQYFWPEAYNCSLPRVQDDRGRLIAKACSRVGLGVGEHVVRNLDQEISWTKQTNVLPEEYPDLAAAAGRGVPQVEPTQVADVIVAYEQEKQANCVIDLDDLLLCTVALLSMNPDVARRVRHAYRSFVFDEFQDVSPVQARLVELWAGDRDDVCVIGDPAQTIHTFAGARSTYLERFAASHPRAVGLSLTKNYRSTPQILELANAVSQTNVPLRPVRPSGQEVQWSSAQNELDESMGIAGWLSEQHSGGMAWEELAVLYRTRRQAESIRQILADERIPFAYQSDHERTAAPGVHLGTLHSAKGREWEAVCLGGMDHASLPHPRTRGAEQVAEERRLLYVGITRARSLLRIAWSTTVRGRSTGLTPFLADLV